MIAFLFIPPAVAVAVIALMTTNQKLNQILNDEEPR